MRKTCSKCRVEKDTSEFYADRKNSDGLYSYCKDHVLAAASARRIANADKAANRCVTGKICSNCQIEKSVADFHKCEGSIDGYQHYCVICTSVAGKVRYAADPGKSIASALAWVAANQDRRRDTLSAWRVANREKVKKARVVWDRGNPEAVGAMHHRRRARKKGAEGLHTAEDIKALRLKQDDRCAHIWCCTPLNGKGQTDHIVPLALGGSDNPDNLQLLCAHCNRSKGAKHPSEFYVKMLEVCFW